MKVANRKIVIKKRDIQFVSSKEHRCHEIDRSLSSASVKINSSSPQIIESI